MREWVVGVEAEGVSCGVTGRQVCVVGGSENARRATKGMGVSGADILQESSRTIRGFGGDTTNYSDEAMEKWEVNSGHEV